MLAQAYAAVRQGSRRAYASGGNQSADMNQGGDLLVAQGLPPKAEVVRMGNTWTCAIATGSAFTYVNAWPTTRAEIVLYNGYASGGLSLVIDSAWMVDITSAAAAQAKTLLGQYGADGIAAPTDDTAQLITSRSGKTYAGSAKRAVANTAFALTNKWEALGTVTNPNTASIGSAVYVDLYGGWIVKPGRAFCLAGLASTAAGTAIIGVTWHEVQLDLG